MSENLYTHVQSMASKLAKKHRTGLKYDNMIQALSDELGDLGEMSLGAWSPDFAFGGAMYTTAFAGDNYKWFWSTGNR